MKFSVTIHDVSFEQMREIGQFAYGLSGDEISGITSEQVAQAEVPQAPVAAPPAPLEVNVENLTGADAETSIPEAPFKEEPAKLDTNGIPWDERIHAKTKSINADGSWKKLRGVDKGLYEQVTAELKLQYASAEVPAVETPPAPPVAPVPVPPAPPVAAAPVATPPAPVPMPPTPPVTPTVQAPTTTIEPPATVTVEVPATTQEIIPPYEFHPTHNLTEWIAYVLTQNCRTDIPYNDMVSLMQNAILDTNHPLTATNVMELQAGFGLNQLPDCANDPVTIGKLYWILGGK